MKKLFTLSLFALVWAFIHVNEASAKALPYYKAWYINQNFNGVAAFNGQTPILGATGTTLPSTWTWNNASSTQGTKTTSMYFTNGASYYFVNSKDSTLFNAFQMRGGGTGGRGGELRFPSTTLSEDKDSTVWYVEFDWKSSSAGFTSVGRNTIGLALSGSNSTNFSDGEKNTDTWYGDSFFMLYAYRGDTVPALRGGPGHLHLVNLDPNDKPATVANANGGYDTIPGAFYRRFHALGGADVARFRRAGDTWQKVDSLNQTTRLNVVYRNGHYYHLKMKLNMASQMMEEFTITQNDSTANSQTLTNIPFLAKDLAGRSSIIAAANRIVKDISRIEGFSLRTSQLGSGGDSNFEYLIDNLEVYVMKPSKGLQDVTISYIDREGNIAKTARIDSAIQIGLNVSLNATDKIRFEDQNNYYAYDAEATHVANANRGVDGESLSVVKDSINTLYVVFKKSPKTTGTYVWSGSNSTNWSELEDNFSVNNVSPYSYQIGNSVEFSDASLVNKEVDINEPINLVDGNLTVSAPNYVLAGTGSLIGNNKMIINAPFSLAMNASALKGGAELNASEVTIQSLTPLADLKVMQDNSVVKFSAPSGTLNLNVEGQGGVLNYQAISNTVYSVKTKNVSTVNLLLKTSGAKSTNYWSGSSASLPHSAQLNVTTDMFGTKMPIAFATNLTMLDSAKVHLGDNVRLIRHANEGSGGTDKLKIGELSGVAGSYLEGGYVDGRASGYEIGSLGTDAVFNGTIRPWLSRIAQGAVIDSTTMTRQPDTLIWGRSGIRIDKVGSGKWTVNGKIIFPGVTAKTMYNSITAKKGTLELNKIYFSDYITKSKLTSTDSAVVAPHAILVSPTATLVLKDSVVTPSVNLVTLKVDTLGTLITNNNYIGVSAMDVLGTINGGVKLGNSFAAYSKATVAMNVAKFMDGNYDVIDAQGDVTIIGSVLDIKVISSEVGQKIAMIRSMGNVDLSFSKVLVNGEDITGITADSPGAKYVWYLDEATNAGTLLSLVKATDVRNPNSTKTIKKVEYFDVLGRQIQRYSKGLVLKRITYDDNSIETQKSYISEIRYSKY